MKIGFELELFCRTPLVNGAGGDYCLVPDGLPYDECGWLVEVRSEPHTDVRKAIALLLAEYDSVIDQATDEGVILVREPLANIPRDLKVQAARKYTKGLLRYRNVYGHENHRTKLATASLHISFTNEQVHKYTSYELDKGAYIARVRTYNYPGFVDHAKLIVGLDNRFKAQIRAAQRNPGFYEVKSDGRIEYRSLPNDIDLNDVREALEDLLEN